MRCAQKMKRRFEKKTWKFICECTNTQKEWRNERREKRKSFIQWILCAVLFFFFFFVASFAYSFRVVIFQFFRLVFSAILSFHLRTFVYAWALSDNKFHRFSSSFCLFLYTMCTSTAAYWIGAEFFFFFLSHFSGIINSSIGLKCSILTYFSLRKKMVETDFRFVSQSYPTYEDKC